MDSSILKFGLVHKCEQGFQKKTKKKNRMTNIVDPDETALQAISSGCTLFAQVLVLVYWAERVKPPVI